MRLPTSSLRLTGFTLIWVLVLLGGLVAVATALAPSYIKVYARDRAQGEEAMLRRIGDGLRLSVRRTQVIPGTRTWVRAVSDATSMDQVTVRQVFPEFPTSATSARAYWIDPRFQPSTGAAILPWTQTAAGIISGSPDTPLPMTRVIIASSDLRSVPLPLASGTLTAAMFDALWDWVPDASGSSPLTSASAAWQGRGEHLHLERVDLRPLFHKLSFRGLGFAVGSGAVTWVTNVSDRYFVAGTPLSLYRLASSAVAIRRVVTSDESFDLSTPYAPVGYWKFDPGMTASIATNSGTLGSAGNAVGTNGVGTLQAGPRPPLQPGYAANNRGLLFDGVNDWLETGSGLMNGFTEFTLACWVRPTRFPTNGSYALLGQRGVAAMGFQAGPKLVVQTTLGGSVLFTYPHPIAEFHHVAVTADGTALRLFVDGVLVATGGTPVSGAGYGTSAFPFRMGGGSIFDGNGNYASARLDEFLLFDKALPASLVSGLVLNQIPN